MFHSKKFWRKLQFVPTLQELSNEAPVGEEYIPESVCARDDQIMATMQSDGRKKYESKEKDPEPSSSSQREEPASSTSTQKENPIPIAPTEEEIKEI